MTLSTNYPDDYERLIALIPQSGKAETLGGEIMRAVNVLSKGKTNRLEALSFLTKVGVLSKEDKDLHSQLNVGGTQGEEPNENRVLALETLADRAISLILMHPDLEYVENEGGFVGCEPEPESTRKSSRRTARATSYNI
jgi:hypothetical protein